MQEPYSSHREREKEREIAQLKVQVSHLEREVVILKSSILNNSCSVLSQQSDAPLPLKEIDINQRRLPAQQQPQQFTAPSPQSETPVRLELYSSFGQQETMQKLQSRFDLSPRLAQETPQLARFQNQVSSPGIGNQQFIQHQTQLLQQQREKLQQIQLERHLMQQERSAQLSS